MESILRKVAMPEGNDEFQVVGKSSLSGLKIPELERNRYP
jgi:hypothetical protein